MKIYYKGIGKKFENGVSIIKARENVWFGFFIVGFKRSFDCNFYNKSDKFDWGAIFAGSSVDDFFVIKCLILVDFSLKFWLCSVYMMYDDNYSSRICYFRASGAF